MPDKVILAHQPCPCGESSDAYAVYENGGHCFSCDKTYFNDKLEGVMEEKKSDRGNHWKDPPGKETYEYREWRGISHDTMAHYGSLTKCFDGEPFALLMPYIRPHKACKVRLIKEKDFTWAGENPDRLLFGQEAFPIGSSDTITITEGELDAMSVFEMTGRPAVSIQGASSARKDCQAQFLYLNSFDKIKLCLDTDGPGQKAKAAISELFDFNKIYEVSMFSQFKDANKYLTEGKRDDFRRLWFNAKKPMPQGVISTFDEFNEAIDSEIYQKALVSFPWPRLEEKLMGMRPGEITLLTAQEGIGKTEIIRALEYHTLRQSDHNLGIIHLEENKARTLKGLAGLHLKEPVHLPDSGVSKEAIKRGLLDLVRREGRLHVYSNFGGDDPDAIIDMMRFIVAVCGCKVVGLDHITMLATGREEDDERKFLDNLSTKLGRLVNELQFHLVLISHVNDDGKTRGSRNIAKIASNRIDIHRDIINPDERERNTTSLTVSKSRFTSLTGPAGRLLFDRETFTLVPEEDYVNKEEDLPV